MKTSYKEIKHNKRRSIIIIISSSILIILLIIFFIIKLNHDNKNVLESYRIEVDANPEPIKIPLKDLPLIYNSLIDGMNLNNKQNLSAVKFQLNRISPKIIYKNNSNIYYILLNYNCGEKLCDYVLIKYNNKKIEEYIYLTFGTYNSSKISKNGDNLAIDFNRQEGSNVFDNLMLINLKKLKLKQYSKIPQEYTYNIVSYDWLENVLNVKYKKDSTENQVIIK